MRTTVSYYSSPQTTPGVDLLNKCFGTRKLLILEFPFLGGAVPLIPTKVDKTAPLSSTVHSPRLTPVCPASRLASRRRTFPHMNRFGGLRSSRCTIVTIAKGGIGITIGQCGIGQRPRL